MPGRIIHAWVSSETEKRKTLVKTSEKGRAKDTKGQLILKGLFGVIIWTKTLTNF